MLDLLLLLQLGNFVNGVEILIENLVHREHVNAVLFKDGTHSIVTSDLPLVCRILEITFFDVLPDFLDRLWTRELGFPEERGERGRKGHGFLTDESENESGADND